MSPRSLPAFALRNAAPLLVALILAGCGAQAQDKSGEPPPPEVTTAAVVTRELRPWDEFTGRLEAVDTVQGRPRVGGYVDGVRFTEGAVVRQGQVLTAEVSANRAKLELAASNRQRAERLVQEEALSRSEYDRLVSEEKAQSAALAAAAAALDSARLNLEFTRVTAPITGRVSRAIVTPGNLVTSSDVLTTVVSDTPIYATFNADLSEVRRLGAQPAWSGLSRPDDRHRISARGPAGVRRQPAQCAERDDPGPRPVRQRRRQVHARPVRPD